MNQSSAMVPSPGAAAPPHDYGGYVSRAFSIFMGDIGKWAIIGLVGALVFGIGFWGGYHYCAAKALRGEAVSIGDVFHPFSRFLSFIALPAVFIGAWIVYAILAFILGSIRLGIVAGLLGFALWLGMIVAGFALIWVYPLMADRGMGFVEAAKMSFETFKGNIGRQIITVLVVGVIQMVAGIVPFALAAAIGMIVLMLAYRCEFYHETAAAAGTGQAAPQQQWGQPQQPQAAPQQQWGQPQQPQAAPQQQWGQPQQPQAAPQQQWGQPQQPQAAPQQQWGQPQQPGAAAQPPQDAWAQQAPAAAAAPQEPAMPAAQQPQAAAAGTVAPVAQEEEENTVETATQSTTVNPNEQFRGKTMAMSASDFEELLKKQQGGGGQG